MNVVLVGLELIGLAEEFNGAFEVACVQARNADGVVLFRRFWRRRSPSGPLPAEPQMHAGPLRDISSVDIYKFLKDFRSFGVVLPMKSPQSNLKTPKGRLVSDFIVAALTRGLWRRPPAIDSVAEDHDALTRRNLSRSALGLRDSALSTC